MAKKSSQVLAKELFEKVQGIKLNNPAAIFGTTSHESMLQQLRKNVAELGTAISNKEPYESVMKKYETVAAGVDTAGITGLISESELQDYYKIIDDLWAVIEKDYR